MKLQPYPKYKPSDASCIGKIPKTWQTIKFRYLFSFGRGLPITKANLQDAGIPCVSYGEIHSKYGFEIIPEKQELKCVKEDYLDQNPESLLQTGDFVFSDTSEDIEGAGNFSHLNSNVPTFAGYHTVIAKPTTDAHPRFLAYVFDSLMFRYQVRRNISGVKVYSITQNILKSCDVWLPSPKEQTQIAKFLDYKTAQIDKLIEKKKQLIEKLNEKRIAVITQAVTKGLDPSVKMEDSGVEWLGAVPEHWALRRLKFLAAEPLKYGANEASTLADRDMPRYIRITDVKEDGTLHDHTFRSLAPETALPYLLNEGDILLARSGATVGKSFIYEKTWGTAAYAGYLIRFRTDKEVVIARYGYFFLRSAAYWANINSALIQSTIQNFSAEKYGNILLPVPPLDEQNAILNYISSEEERINKSVLLAKEAISKFEEYRTALITAAVTGQIDVRDFKIPEKEI